MAEETFRVNEPIEQSRRLASQTTFSGMGREHEGFLDS